MKKDLNSKVGKRPSFLAFDFSSKPKIGGTRVKPTATKFVKPRSGNRGDR